ncbi:MAG: site-specific DNA-methyltransferase [Desulfobacteraceae bacterium]|nr:site-specific DNA-methyltransferase [Desulfobacteraceae bacterium]
MEPYFETSQITIYHGDCRDILPNIKNVNTIISDPPYGINIVKTGKIGGNGNKYKPMIGDDSPFDPAFLLHYPKVCLWGANHYASRLPDSSRWFLWDKREDDPSNSFADAELAWVNLKGPARIFRYLWNGYRKKGEIGQKRVHPTQKPVALMRWCTEMIRPDGLICDPYMGSGSVLRAAADLGYAAVGIEIEERYCEAAARRFEQLELPFDI